MGAEGAEGREVHKEVAGGHKVFWKKKQRKILAETFQELSAQDAE